MSDLAQKILNKISIENELESAFFDIPFGNSQFQIRNFIVNAAHTPERAYRAVGLTIFEKIRALKEAYYKIKKENIDIEELEEKIADRESSVYDVRRWKIDIEQKIDARRYTRKLVNDALAELDCLYKIYKKLKPISRAEFEAKEETYFKIKLQKHANGITGALESLDNMSAGFLDISKEKKDEGSV